MWPLYTTEQQQFRDYYVICQLVLRCNLLSRIEQTTRLHSWAISFTEKSLFSVSSKGSFSEYTLSATHCGKSPILVKKLEFQKWKMKISAKLSPFFSWCAPQKRYKVNNKVLFWANKILKFALFHKSMNDKKN